MRDHRWRVPRTMLSLLLAASMLGSAAPPVGAASHSDAPLIKQDPQANLTDVYAFVGRRYDDPNRAVFESERAIDGRLPSVICIASLNCGTQHAEASDGA